MIFLIILLLFLAPCKASDYYNNYAYEASSYNTPSVSDNMSINTFEPDTMHDFLQSPNDAPEDSETPKNWYKLNKDGKQFKNAKNYQNNILRIILDEIAEQFANNNGDRNEILQQLLEYFNNFIDTHYIPKDYQRSISTIYRYISALQNEPIFNAPALIYKELSNEAKQAFKNGRRAQTNSLENNFQNQQNSDISYQADQILIEILFLQTVIDAQKTIKNRQALLDSIDKKMQKIESFFRDDNSQVFVGNFDSIRSSIMSFVQNESPIPALFSHVLNMINNTKERKELTKKYADNLEPTIIEDISADDLKYLKYPRSNKEKENIWKKITKNQNYESDDEEGNKKKNKKKSKSVLAKIEQNFIEKAEEQVSGNANQTVEGLLGNLSNSIGGLLPGASNTSTSGIAGQLGSLFG